MAYPQNTFRQTSINRLTLLQRRRAAVASNTLRYQLNVLRETGRYAAFQLNWHPVYSEPPEVWPIPNHLFWDSDVAKWIEGACYILPGQDMPDIDDAIAELVEMIRKAQQPDGYINIHYTVVEPGKRFTNLRDMHELYNAGHLIEAALAHNDHYQNDLLLAPILKYVDLLCTVFGPGSNQIHGYPGHPEIELALLRLYERTREPRHLALARYFITERGNATGCEGRHYFDVEADKRGDDPARRPAFYPEPRCMWYHQAHAPIVDQQTVEGHAVRATYLLTAVADLIRLDDSIAQGQLPDALDRLWHNMVGRKMYVTGGIGAIKQWEGFAQDFFLPQSTNEGGCYAETCAAIGVMMLANRLLQIKRHAEYADVLELCLYNAVLTAMSHEGTSFSYVNQLASSETDLSKREAWFTVACCPPNILRLLGQIGGYLWQMVESSANKPAEIVVHLYTSAEAIFDVDGTQIKIKQKTDWPLDGHVEFELDASIPVAICLRVPAWAKNHELSPSCADAHIVDGYLYVPSSYTKQHAKFSLTCPMTPRWIASHPRASHATVSVARGPIVYCVEDTDNPWVDDHFESLHANVKSPLHEELRNDEQSGESYVAVISSNGIHKLPDCGTMSRPFLESQETESLLSRASTPLEEVQFIPYYFRANRGGKCHMRVGLRLWGQDSI